MAHDPPPTYTEEEINHPMYCQYHAMLLHPTDRCPIVRDWIETLIQRGKIDSEGNSVLIFKVRRKKSNDDLLDKRRGFDGIKSRPLTNKPQGARSQGSTPKICLQMRSQTQCITKRAMSDMDVLGLAPNKVVGPGPGQSLPSLPYG
ncbi:hypothetical protein Taro_020428 [Colocasia esculenta]|uniref:Uncharacterized protein n=1 Tax=Colocasia esculenta TaxID=4460 RepID=A0A843UZK7_COLES|nr:hypothetical protein [Colocasia esculenta]